MLVRMTTGRLQSLNRRKLIEKLLCEAPWLTQDDIARLVGNCSRQYVSDVKTRWEKSRLTEFLLRRTMCS